MIYVAAYCWDCVQEGSLCDDCGRVFAAIERADDLESYAAIAVHLDDDHEPHATHTANVGTAIATATAQRLA